MGLDMDLRWLSDDIIFDKDFYLDKLIDDFSSIAYEMAKKLNFNKQYVVINRWNIFAALQRYSRDIFGFSRLKTCLEKNSIEKSIIDNIIKEVKHEHRGLGLRIVSEAPYMHKRIAFFLYYFSIMKPFAINFRDSIDTLNEKQVDNIIHFNSIVSFSCAQRFLLASSGFIDGKKYRGYLNCNYLEDKSLLHDLTYRALNRSSLEIVMHHMISLMPEDEYQKKLKEYRQVKPA